MPKKPLNHPESIYALNETIIYRKNFDGTLAIMDLDNDDSVFSLDGIACDIWNEFNGKRPLRAINQKMLKKYDIAPTDYDKNCKKLITSLLKNQLIHKVE